VEAFVRFGQLEVAINNASTEISGPTLDLPSEDFGTIIDTNLKGTYYGMKHQVAQMRKNGGGAIVNQASVTSSITGVPDNGLYAETKGRHHRPDQVRRAPGGGGEHLHQRDRVLRLRHRRRYVFALDRRSSREPQGGRRLAAG
jgi:hypothetical protein